MLALSGVPGCSNGGFCDIPELAPGASANLTAKVRIAADAAAGTVENIACVEAANAPQRCDEATQAFSVAADLSVAKRAI